MGTALDIQNCAPAAADRELSMLVHDIRNLLHGINGIVELMSGGVMRVGQHDAVEVAQHSLVTMMRKMDLLRASQQGRTVVQRREEVDCFKQVSTLCAAFTPAAQARGIGLSVRMQGPPCSIHVDSLSLNRLLSNLIMNAIQHSRASEIEVRVCTEAARVVFTVSDNGVGMSADARRVARELLAHAPLTDAYRRQGLLSCVQCAQASGARLQLVEDRKAGVQWDLYLQRVGTSSPGVEATAVFA